MTTATKFENRVRFNWGYHDAAHGVRRGKKWQNYGFGDALKIDSPKDVMEKHHDKAYALGWTFGYYEALGGGICNTSEYAWKNATEQGKITE